MLALALNVLNLGYAFDGSFTRLREFTFISSALTGLENSGQVGNRFADTWLGMMPVPLPKHYVLGLDAQRHDFEEPPWQSYLRGEWKSGGWWYYYIYGLAVKVPHGTQMLFAVAVVLSLSRIGGPANPNLVVLLFPALILFTLVSSQTTFNAHFRYVLPVFGFIFVFIGSSISRMRI